MVRPTPHPRLDPRRPNRSRQSDLALQIPPHPFPAERLDLPHQHRRTTRMDPTPMDRPRSTTPPQHPHPTHQNPTPVGPARPTTNTRSGMRSFDQLVLSQPLSSLVNSQVFGRGVP